MSSVLLIPTTIDLEVIAPEGVEIVTYDPTTSLPDEHTSAEFLVVWGMPDPLLREAARRLTRLRWVQLLSAGSDAAVAAGFAPEVVITSGRSLHDEPVSEHALALILAAARRLHTLTRAQLGHRWATEIGGAQREPSPGLFSTLRNANVLVWGFGSIAKTLAPHLTALGAHVTGVATSAREENGYPVIAREQLPQHLPSTDLLVMILPSTPSTDHALDADLLALLPAHAWVVNVGRGSTIDETALHTALAADRLGGAALDVTKVEPLPVVSPLWDLPNAIITPHAAGGRPLGASALISENLAALQAGDPLRNVVEH